MSRVPDLLVADLCLEEASIALDFDHQWRSDQENGSVLRVEKGSDDVHDGHEGVRRHSQPEGGISKLLNLVASRAVESDDGPRGLYETDQDLWKIVGRRKQFAARSIWGLEFTGSFERDEC
jgi:hypothetical protein